jgi:hypothetical protein
MTEHLAARPSWLCRDCRSSWPCPAARRDLTIEFRQFPSVLTIYLSALLYEAARDLGTMPDLYDRFVLWARDETRLKREDGGRRAADTRPPDVNYQRG